jgi:hypothetical protein
VTGNVSYSPVKADVNDVYFVMTVGSAVCYGTFFRVAVQQQLFRLSITEWLIYWRSE